VRVGGGSSYFTTCQVVGPPEAPVLMFSVDNPLLYRTFCLAFPVVSAFVIGEHGGGCLWWKGLAARLERDYGLVYTPERLKELQIENAFRVAADLEAITAERTGREVPVYVHYSTPSDTGLQVEYLGGYVHGLRVE
jgi:hypothetical protein